jgi:hypothetical protein
MDLVFETGEQAPVKFYLSCIVTNTSVVRRWPNVLDMV